MKLIKQTSLAFRAGTSDKVYEVDLCEVGPDQYVVNFRYGRRGATLRDGSKTVMPVSRAEADKIFDKLVSSKVSKGYQDAASLGAAPAAAAPTPSAPTPSAGGPYRSTPSTTRGNASDREAAILERLRRGDRRAGPLTPRNRRRQLEGWPLSRAAWRAGELGLSAAEPLLIELVQKHASARSQPDRVLRHSAIWALGRCGSTAAFPALQAIYGNRSQPDTVRAIAGEAMRRIYSEADRQRFIETIIDALPPALRGAAKGESADREPAEAFAEALPAEVTGAGRGRTDLLSAIYLIDNEHVRPGLYQLVASTELNNESIRWLRTLYRAAEFRRDGKLFGLIARRLESPAAKQVLHSQTYWRRRTWRTLRRMGELGDPEWIKMAVGVLLPYSDDDAVEPLSRRYYVWRGPSRDVNWGPWAPYWAFNHLLYGQSRRITPDRRGKAFRQATSNAHREKPTHREEAFPELWDDAPFGLMHLLDESRCEPVHVFAVKALRANAQFTQQLDLEALVMLLSRPYEVTARFGFELAEGRYSAAEPDHELVAAVATCAYEPARKTAQRWIDADRQRFVEDGDLMAAIALAPFADTRQFARDLLRSAIISEQTARAVIGRIIAALLELSDSEADGERADDVAQTLLRSFAQHIKHIGPEVLRDLIKHPLTQLHELAGDILLGHAELSSKCPNDVLIALLTSSSESVRGIGARLVGQLPDDDLAERPELLLSLTMHAHADLRSAIRPVLGRLAQSKPEFAARIGAILVEELRDEQPEGVHSHIVSVLRNELRSALPKVGKDEVFRLLRSKIQQAQELGGVLLADNVDPSELSVGELVGLGKHAILTVRQACFAMCQKSVERLKQAAPKAVRLLDSRWEDARQFAFEFFREHFGPEQLTPQILVSICDSIRDDVQAFGREMITRYFDEAHGDEYLLKLSEHPSEALQIFATNYLQRFAADHPERLEELEHFFIAILSRVNKGRVAKSRVLAFLGAEAQKSEAAARFCAELFSRQSVTIAIGDKASLIEGLLRIDQSYPEVDTPLQIAEPEVRGGAAASTEAQHGV